MANESANDLIFLSGKAFSANLFLLDDVDRHERGVAISLSSFMFSEFHVNRIGSVILEFLLAINHFNLPDHGDSAG